MISKRLFDLFFSGLGLIVLGPFFLLVGIAIKLDSDGPVFFRQIRVGQRGRLFRIHKFRTMVTDAESRGPQITVGADIRVTSVGAFLRKYKIDELVQLIDVFLGDMSLVGPRPEVPKYVDCYPLDAREVILSVKPGITDWASIKYKDENDVLGMAVDPHKVYVEEVLPIKIRYYVDYVRNRSFWGDVRIIFATIRALVR